MYTPQEIYDKVCAHLAQQKTRSRIKRPDGEMDCGYRAPDGKSCAIGCLIPDEMYRPEMDFPPGELTPTSADWLFRAFPEVAEHIGHVGLCQSLQFAHDYEVDAEAIQKRLRDAARNHGIEAGAEQAITEWNG